MEDKEEMINLISSIKYEFEASELEEIHTNSTKFIVYKQDSIKGFAYITMTLDDAGEKVAQVNLYVEPTSRLQGIGSALYKELESHLLELNPDYVCSYMRVDLEDRGGFAKKMGFQKWWGSKELLYRGDGFPKNNLVMVKYDDTYFSEFVQINRECYYPIQKSNDIKPYVATEELIDTYKLNDKENVFLWLQNEELIASISLGDGTIENVVVSPAYQGKGYGRKVMQFGINELIKRGYHVIRICYMENNQSAERLYNSLGFQFVQLTHVYRKFL